MGISGREGSAARAALWADLLSRARAEGDHVADSGGQERASVKAFAAAVKSLSAAVKAKKAAEEAGVVL